MSYVFHGGENKRGRNRISIDIVVILIIVVFFCIRCIVVLNNYRERGAYAYVQLLNYCMPVVEELNYDASDYAENNLSIKNVILQSLGLYNLRFEDIVSNELTVFAQINRTIQIGDTGISPGAGVGNNRMQINEKSLGVKVLAVGVPTVVDAATIANDTIDMVLDDLIGKVESGKDFYSMLQKVDKNEKQMLIREILTPFVGELIVTPKDIDTIIESLAKIIADGINIAVQPEMEMEEINKFLN